MATTLVLTEISQQNCKDCQFRTDIQHPQRMNPIEFGDPLTLPLSPALKSKKSYTST